MKFNQVLLPALTLVAGAVADCAWHESILMSQGERDQLSLEVKCPPPQNDGDVYTKGDLKMNHCLVTKSNGKIGAQKDGGAFNSVPANACYVEDNKTLNCGDWGSLPISDIVSGEAPNFSCYGYTAETKTETMGSASTATPSESAS